MSETLAEQILTDTSSQIQLNMMTLDDVPYVAWLEQLCFTSPWSEATYRHEIQANFRAFYYVMRPALSSDSVTLSSNFEPTQPRILAYGGFWLMGDEAHIVTIASHPEWRRRQLGELMLLLLLIEAHDMGARSVTLEVRPSNLPALALYQKQGFEEVGRRKRYYRDNDEDALLLTLFYLNDDEVFLPMLDDARQLAATIKLVPLA